MRRVVVLVEAAEDLADVMVEEMADVEDSAAEEEIETKKINFSSILIYFLFF